MNLPIQFPSFIQTFSDVPTWTFVQGDLDGDGTDDCVAGGRAGVLFALSGKTGRKLWQFESHLVKTDLMSVYAAQFVQDVNSDRVPDILAVHGGT